MSIWNRQAKKPIDQGYHVIRFRDEEGLTQVSSVLDMRESRNLMIDYSMQGLKPYLISHRDKQELTRFLELLNRR